jgi:Peroxidase, family 2
LTILFSGIDTSENIIRAVREGANMEANFSAFVVSFATMARGNPNIAMLSIGFESDRVPPLPGCIDGPVAGGLAMHGRFEGDVSSSRTDHGIGDSVNFNATMFKELLGYVAELAGDGPEGPKTVVNIPTFQEFKYMRYLEDQAEDKELQFHIGRQLTTYTEVAFILELMQDGERYFG